MENEFVPHSSKCEGTASCGCDDCRAPYVPSVEVIEEACRAYRAKRLAEKLAIKGDELERPPSRTARRVSQTILNGWTIAGAGAFRRSKRKPN